MQHNHQYREFESPDRVRRALWSREALSFFDTCADLGLAGVEDEDLIQLGSIEATLRDRLIASRKKQSTPLSVSKSYRAEVKSEVVEPHDRSKRIFVYDIGKVYAIFEPRLPQDGRGHIPNDIIKGRLNQARELGYNIPSYSKLNHSQLFATYLSLRSRVLGEYRESQRPSRD